jgi:hypothetical protein
MPRGREGSLGAKVVGVLVLWTGIGSFLGVPGAMGDARAAGLDRSPESAAGPSPGNRLSSARVSRSWQAGAACLRRDHDGFGFRDPYLTFVYPGEALPTPPGLPPLTYRRIDADFILALLDGQSPPGGEGLDPIQGVAAAARRRLSRTAPLWRSRRLSNVRRQPSPQGIALDTYCMVGWLAQDRVMAQNVARAIDGDGWLPQNLYSEEERFRADADECWCLKLLASPSGPGLAGASPILARIAATLRRAATSDPGSRAAFYEAFHLGMVLEEVQRAGRIPGRGAGAGEGDAHDAQELKGEAREALRIWADRQAGASSPALVEWANLATCEILDDETGKQLRRRAVEVLLEAQGKDGCWRLRGAEPASYGSSFLTLRALLGLAASRSGFEASRSGAASGPPAPKAARPAQ